jgi:hypothetical protein
MEVLGENLGDGGESLKDGGRSQVALAGEGKGDGYN